MNLCVNKVGKKKKKLEINLYPKVTWFTSQRGWLCSEVN